MDSRTASQPESYSDIISRSLVLYRLSFSTFILYAFLMALTVFIPRLISDAIGHEILANLSPLSLQRLWFLAIEIVALIFFIAIIWRMHCYLRGRHEPMIEDLRKGIRKVVAVVLAAILQCALLFAFSYMATGFIIFLGYIHFLFNSSTVSLIFSGALFVLIAFLLIYITTLFDFVIPVIAIENKGVFKAIETSVSLVWNHWWRVFSVQITPWIIFVIALGLIKYALHFDVHIYFTLKTHHDIGSTLLNLVLFTFFIPWVAALLITQLRDLELRKKLAESIK